MRLTPAQAKTIKDAVSQITGPNSRVWLLGSRVNDTLRRGGIDLFVGTDDILPNRIEALCKLEGKLIMAPGDRKLDILLEDGRTQEANIFGVARQNGVRL